MSSLVERLRVRSVRRPSYNDDDWDDDLEAPPPKAAGHAPANPPERLTRNDAKEGLCQACQEGEELISCESCNYSYHPKCLLPPLRAAPAGSWSCPECVSMSSLVERLRVRSVRRPSYNDDDWDDDLEAPPPKAAGHAPANPPERLTRNDAKEGLCQACQEGEELISCESCNYSYHPKCLLPPLRAAPAGSWSCPECVGPLNEIDKILDCEMRPTAADEKEASKLGSKQKFVKQYLVKWKGLSYLHCTWVPEKEFLKAFKTNTRLRSKVNNFHRQVDATNNSGDDLVAIRPEWTTVDRIIASRNVDDEREYLVKWKDLPYDECHWEVESDISAFQPQIEQFHERQSRGHKSRLKSSNRDGKESKFEKESRFKQKEFQQYEKSPKFLAGGSLHPYQLEGLNFLRFSWSKHTHVILADEMGLGKTIQSIAFLASLHEEKLYPYLVIAPLSTLRNWEREFTIWAPHMNVVMYVGGAPARSVIRQYEFFLPIAKSKKLKRKKLGPLVKESKQKRIKFDVLLTSYEMINMDSASLKSIKWECMIVDEGHRLKNKDSKLFLSLKDYSTNHRVLLTGTPLQNNLDELFMLMHFLDAGKFASLEEFQEEFKDINQEEQVARLHKMLAPHLLRRVKKDVMKDLPPKKELILRVELSSLQKEYYKAILTRNYQILARKGGAQISLNNVVMELRKLCCHGYMLEGVDPGSEDANEAYRGLLESSGKMLLLDKMLVRLKEQGHRVLIYSQFQHMLDLLEDYLMYKSWSYERIDGSINGAERQIRIDRFNSKNSTRFCFLLSTRAGGLGINLATADTVIIYDSDWNPHADLQAMARAHRLGQTNKVMIYRLVTRGTIEERMMEMTKKKMILEHLVVGRMKNQMLNQEELDDIIRYGSKELFSEDSDEIGKARQIHYDDAAIERLLDRDQIENEESTQVDEEENGFLKAFKVANFEYVDEEEAAAAAAAAEEEAKKQAAATKHNVTNAERASYWEELLKERYEVHRVDEASSLGKRKRNRKQVVSAGEDDDEVEGISSDDDEADWNDPDMVSANPATKRTILSRKRGRADSSEPLPLMDGEGKSFRVLGFNQQQRAQFVQLLMRFGFGNYDWSDFIPRMKQKTLEEIHEYGFLMMNHLAEEINEAPNFADGVPKEGLRVVDIHVRNATLSLIREKVELLAGKPEMPLFEKDIMQRYPALTGGRVWKENHDKALLQAVLKHGYGRWQSILDKEPGFFNIIRVEINLPDSIFGGMQMHDGVNSVGADGVLEPSYQESSMYSYRDAQRRMVEFVKKRVYLLEKGLNAEYAKLYFGELKANECLREEFGVERKISDIPDPEAFEAEIQMTTPMSPIVELDIPDPEAFEAEIQMTTPMSPIVELAPDELSGASEKNRAHCVGIFDLYNKMSTSVTEIFQDAVEASRGDESAATRLNTSACRLEGLCEDVSKILRVPEKASLNTVEQTLEEAERMGEALVREAVPLKDPEQHKKCDEIELLSTAKKTGEIRETSEGEKVIVLD